jgi:hypothetical protein
MTDSVGGSGGSPLRGLGLGERLVGLGCLLMLVSLFPTWMGANLYYTGCTSCTAPGGHKNGFAGIGILVVLVLLGTLALLAVRTFAGTALPAGLADLGGLAFLAAGVVELVCVFVYYAEFHTVSTGGNRSPSVGLYGAVIAALLTAVGGVMARRRTAGHAGTGVQQHGADPYGAGQ